MSGVRQSNPPRSFGKRGGVVMPERNKPLPGTPGEVRPAAPPTVLGVPKWAIGAVAGLFLMALVATGGGMGGGGLFGGLLGGFLAHKLFGTFGSGAQTAQPRPATGTSTTHTANQTISRGGFGSTGSSFGFSGG